MISRLPSCLGVGLLLLLATALPPASRAEDAPGPAPAGRTEQLESSLAEEPLLSLDSPVGPIVYRAGRGLRFGRSGLNVGGFTTVEFDRENGEPASLELDSVNFLVLLEPVERLRGFAEVEVGDLFAYRTNSDDVHSDAKADFERLYGDLSLDDPLNLRIGKFQTPIGRWNLVPAEPFVWTASEPAVFERAFDEHETGGAFFGSVYPGSGTLQYWLHGQFLDPLDPGDTPEPADRSLGGRLQYDGSRGRWSIGSSYLATELHDEWSHLGGLDAEWRWKRLRLTSEFVFQKGDVRERDVWDVYVQGVLEVLPRFHLVARYEHLDSMGANQDADLADLGVAWIPWHFLRLQADYRVTTRETEDVRRGLSASLSFVF